LKAQMYDYNIWIPNMDHEKLVAIMRKLLINSKFGIMGFTDCEFHPQGYSCVFLLSESHLAIHTFPEENSINLQLSSCVAEPFLKFTRMINILELGL